MNFYKCILFITYIYIILSKITTATESDLKLLDTGLESVSPFAIGLQFYVAINNTSEKDYDVELSSEKCCLKSDFDLDFDSLDIAGNCQDYIPKGTKKSLKLVAPLLSPLDRRGYCIIYFDSKLTNEFNRIERKIIKINFDTYVENKKQSMDLPYNIKKCDNVDQDPLNNCSPVQCETHYNGRKPYYSEKRKRCVATPICIPSTKSELPAVILNPITNTCIRGRSILDEDIEFIKSLEKPRIRNLTKSVGVTIINKDKFNTNYLMGKPYSTINPSKFRYIYENVYRNIHTYVVNNKITLIVLVTVVLIQCCLICALIYYVTNKCDCFGQNQYVSRLYRFNTDVSMTTPLIFSNTDTDTSGYKYLSESSNNVDKKIKCYKSCQKGRNGVKMSMSDDILSKCLTRRDWIDNKYTKSEAIPDISLKYSQIKHNSEGHTVCDINKSLKKDNDEIVSTRKSSEAKVVFEDERCNVSQNNAKNDRIVKNIVQKIDYNWNKETMPGDKKGSESSEKEIKCHSYDCLNTSDAKIANKIDLHTSTDNNKAAISLSTDKGAQACFSNDSIDDFLSERGMVFLGRDDMSKYTFSYTSNHHKHSSSSEISSKTSKNNIVKNMLDLLHLRSKYGISSDPGISMNDNMDIELLHMSHASVFTSSNDSECMKELAKKHDSRTSL